MFVNMGKYGTDLRLVDIAQLLDLFWCEDEISMLFWSEAYARGGSTKENFMRDR